MDTKTNQTLPENLTNRLFESRTIIISGEINQKLAANIVAQLIGMAADSDGDITLFINSQGGHVEAGDTIHDMIRFIRPRTHHRYGLGGKRRRTHFCIRAPGRSVLPAQYTISVASASRWIRRNSE